MRSKRPDKGGDISGLSSLLGGVVPNRAWPRNLARAPIFTEWDRLVGPAIAAQTQPWYFNRDDCLVVAVSEPIWMQQLSYERDNLLEKVNSCLPKEAAIKGLSFRLADVAEVRRLLRGRKGLMEEALARFLDQRGRGEPTGRARAGQTRKGDGHLEELEQALGQLDDEGLRQAFASLADKARLD